MDNKSIEFDRKLVSDGMLTFKNNDDIFTLGLLDDGTVNCTKNNVVESSQPFSKSSIIDITSSLLKEGYELCENTQNLSNDNIDKSIDDMTADIEQDIQKVDKLQSLKDELMDKVDNLVNESKKLETIDTFESNDVSSKKLSYEDIDNLSDDNLTNNQKEYICLHYGSLDTLKSCMKELYDLCSVLDETISLDDYIDILNKEEVQ